MKQVMQQFIDVWKLDFLSRFVAGQYRNTRATIVFWIVTQSLIAVLMCVQVVWFFVSSQDDLLRAIDTHVPHGAGMQFQDGKLTIDNVQMPFFREINAQNSTGGNGSVAVIIDVESQAYSLSSLDEYDGGVIFLNDRAYVKDGAELDEIRYADVPNFSLTKDQLMTFVREKYLFPFATLISLAVMIMLVCGLLVSRAIMALWWALMLYVLAAIFDVRIGFNVAYRAVLHFYVIPAIAILITGFVSVSIPYMPSVLFLIIFVGNLWWMRNDRQKKEQVEAENAVAQAIDEPRPEAVDRSDPTS